MGVSIPLVNGQTKNNHNRARQQARAWRSLNPAVIKSIIVMFVVSPSRRYIPGIRVARFEVDHVCNLTDVDDKIIARMARDGVSLKDLTGKYAQLFFDDLAKLNIVPASRYPRATEHIDDIVEMVQV